MSSVPCEAPAASSRSSVSSSTSTKAERRAMWKKLPPKIGTAKREGREKEASKTRPLVVDDTAAGPTDLSPGVQPPTVPHAAHQPASEFCSGDKGIDHATTLSKVGELEQSFKQRWSRSKTTKSEPQNSMHAGSVRPLGDLVAHRMRLKDDKSRSIRLVFINCNSRSLELGLDLKINDVIQILAAEFGRTVAFRWQDGHEKVVVDDDDEWNDLCREIQQDADLNGQMQVELVGI